MNNRFFPYLLLPVLMLSFTALYAQKGSLYGVVRDAQLKEPLIGVNVILQGTTRGVSTDFDGKYEISDISPGQYSVEFSYLGYEKKLFTGIRIEAGKRTELNANLGESVLTIDQEIVIIGERPLVDVTDPKATKEIGAEVIQASPVRQIENILNTQTGIVQNPEGVYIRGGRTYETGFFIDGVSAKDPLSGTGFGIDIGTNSINKIEVNTSSSDVEYGNATSGLVNTKTRSGGDKLEFSFLHKRDNFDFNRNWNSVFNEQVFELGIGGPMFLVNKIIPGKLKYFISARARLTDEFTKNPADQLVSSIYPGKAWAPYQDNRWSGLIKLNYDFDPRKKLSVTYVNSLTINQNTNMLRITGNDVVFRPGFQYNFSLQPDNANTYTHATNMTSLQWQHTKSTRFSYRVQASRLFVKLRADANGRDWRPQNVDTEFDPTSIVEFPVNVYNPEDSIVFVNPAPGLVNNGGIATLWHDHVVKEYTLKAIGNLYSKNTFNRFSFGFESQFQHFRWIDIIRPWIGAPIPLPGGGFSQSFRLGDISDVWEVKPTLGALFVSDKIKFRGLIADVGLRFEYWMPGKFVDDAIENPLAPIRDEIRQDYRDKTIKLGNRRMKTRLLPKFSASFPIKENQMMFFNYGHSTVMPHPSFVYQGLNPLYTDRSTFSRLGNPDLNPEVDISYELGLKSQLTANDALNLSAFWKDKYDFITSSNILVPDATGREVNRTIRINSDYARVRGLEAAYIKRIGKWFNGQVSVSYSVATGQSSSSSETLQEILATGNRETTRETFLAWDSPLDLKGYAIFTLNNKEGFLNKVKAINKMSLYAEAIYRTGRRYTPYIYQGDEPVSGRPIYEMDPDPEKRYSKLGSSLFWFNLNYKKWWMVKSTEIAFTAEITNLFNNRNAAIINPVTGRAYQYGDPVPSEWQDPRFIDPRDPRSSNTPPYDPARFFEQRHFLLGLSVKF